MDTQTKIIIAAGVAIAIAGVAAVTLGGTASIGPVTGNGKVDASKNLKTDVINGDTSVSGQGMNLKGISVGGSIGQIGSNTNSKAETVTDESEGDYTEGN